MSYEEEFDRIIRKKAEELDFPFDEGNWEKASRMLDAERTRAPLAGGAKSYWTSVVVSVAGVAIVVTVLGSYLDLNKDASRPVAAKDARSLQINVPAATSEIASSSEVSQVASEMVVPEARSNVADAAGQEIIQTENIEPATISAASGKSAHKAEQAAASRQTEQKLPVGFSANINRKGAANYSPDETKPLPPVPVAAVDQPEAGGQEPAPGEPAGGREIEAPVESEAVQAETLQMIGAALDNGMQERDLSPSVIFLSFYDDYYNKRRQFQQFGIEAGAAWLPGWETSAGKDGSGLNWYAGICYGAQLYGRLGIATGFQAYNITHIRQSFYAQQGVDYHFGSTQTGTTITASNLLYVALPLQVTFRVTRAGFFGAGVNAAYLASAENRVQTYTVLDNVRTAGPSESNKGVYDGVKPFNMMLVASYVTSICPRLAVKAEFNYGLTDIFSNTATIRNAERSTGFRLGIRYILSEK